MTVTTLTVTESSVITYDRASTAPKPPRIDAIAPMIGIPAASRPPKTSTMTTREIGSETASARTRSLSITSLIEREMRWLLDAMAVALGMAALTSEPNIRRRVVTASLATRSSSDESPSASRTCTTKPFPSVAMNGRILGSGGDIAQGSTTVLTPEMAVRSVRAVAIAGASLTICAVFVMSTPCTRSRTVEPPAELSRITLARSDPLPGTRGSDGSSLSKIPWPPTPTIASAAEVIVSTSHSAMTMNGCLVVRRPRATNTFKLSHIPSQTWVSIELQAMSGPGAPPQSPSIERRVVTPLEGLRTRVSMDTPAAEG